MKKNAQVLMEFTFSMIVVALLIMGMVKVFTWSGRDLVERRKEHERVLFDSRGGGRNQTRPVFFTVRPIAATVNSSVFGDMNP